MENETRSMVGLLYVLKDEKCGKCGGKGLLPPHQVMECHGCNGKGFRTFKVELSDALRRIKGA